MERNDSRKTVSVVLTVFNGEAYLQKQIESILPQLNEEDELIVMDDGSKDQSIRIIQQFVDKHSCVKLVEGAHVGVNANFWRGIRGAKGNIICLCDQDDIWYENKLCRIREILEKEDVPTVLMHDARMVSAEEEDLGETMFAWRPYHKGFFRNWWKNTYTGCRMAINQPMKELLNNAPENVPMYDQWIGLMAEKYGKTIILEETLMNYRRHSGNVTNLSHRSLLVMINDRIQLLFQYLKYIFRR